MSIIFPITSWIFLFLIFHEKDSCWRNASLSATLIWGVLVAAITEVLSLIKSVNYSGILASWLLIDILLFLLFLQSTKKAKIIEKYISKKIIVQPFYILLLICVALISFTVALIALIAPPNNWDAMAYHMPRVVHWIQNRSVAHYPTSYTPQLYSAPWAEFTIMHFQVLSGGDRFANLVQWFSMVGSLIGVSLIAKQLEADVRGQIFSVVVCVSIPVGILHASNTKNTYVVAFWLVCFVYYILLAIKREAVKNVHLKFSISLALAIFTKGTAYIYALPFIIWFLLIELKRNRSKPFKHVWLMAACILLINIGHYLRNINVFGSFTSTFPYKWTNDVYTLPTFISNIVRNASLHMVIPFNFAINDGIERAIYKIHQALGVSLYDPRTTLLDTENSDFFSILTVPTFEDTAGNPIQFWLLLFSIALYLINHRLIKNKYIFSYLVTVLFSFLLFCFLLKWQPWHSRLHLPIFILLSPFISIILSKLCNERIGNYLMFFLITSSLLWILYGEPRTIMADKSIFNTSRSEQYFSLRSDLKDDYINAVNFVSQKKCKNIGLVLRKDAWEYPLWVLLNNHAKPQIRIEHISVNNPSSVKSLAYPFRNFTPCAIISVGAVQSKEISIKDSIYVKMWQSTESLEPVEVFVKE